MDVDISRTAPYEPDFDSDNETDSDYSLSYQFEPPNLDDAEDLEKYVPGGFHPVYIGETYQDGRYKILHKLGSGGFSTVWLALDQHENRYVTLKFIAAESSGDYKDLSSVKDRLFKADDKQCSDYFVAALGRFWFHGPNGHHLCEVMPVLGPSMSQLSGFNCRLKPWATRKLAFQATQALAFLHSQGLCHGDLTSSNILTRLPSLDLLPEDEIYTLLGTPKTAPVVRYSRKAPGPSAPEYVVNQADLTRLQPQDRICVTDFDRSFPASTPPSDILGTPKKYLAPEAVFELCAGPKSDVWALACAIFRMRAGFDLFHDALSASPAPALLLVAEALGPFPERWAGVKFDPYGWPVSSTTPPKDAKRAGLLVVDQNPSRPLMNIILDIFDERHSNSPNNGSQESGQLPIFWLPPPPKTGYSWSLIKSDGHEGLFEPISKDEALCFHDLLSKMFAYEPDRRPSAEEVLKHPWFQWVGN